MTVIVKHIYKDTCFLTNCQIFKYENVQKMETLLWQDPDGNINKQLNLIYQEPDKEGQRVAAIDLEQDEDSYDLVEVEQ